MAGRPKQTSTDVIEKIFLDAASNPQNTQITQIFSMTLKKNRSNLPSRAGSHDASASGLMWMSVGDKNKQAYFYLQSTLHIKFWSDLLVQPIKSMKSCLKIFFACPVEFRFADPLLGDSTGRAYSTGVISYSVFCLLFTVSLFFTIKGKEPWKS
jgi:hypothetical protein